MALPQTDSFNKLLFEKIVWDVLESITDAVVTIDEEHRIVHWNAAAEKMFGYAGAELAGIDVSPLIPVPHHHEHRGYVNRYIETREPRVIGRSRECHAQRKNGTTFPVEISYSVSHTEGRLYFTAVIRDTSERKKMERDMRFMEKLADIGKAVANVVHEIRKPLVLIGGFARQVADTCALAGNEKDSRKLEIVVGEVKRLETLLNGIRLLIRPPSSGEKQGLFVNDLLRETLDLLDPMLEGRNIALSVDLAGHGLQVRADADQLKQVFLNLLQNAAEAIEGTGIILVASRLNGRLVEIRIEDDGPGIPDELLDKIFDPFFTTKREGTGLGLPICRNIVQDHGGELIVQSERGRGAVLLIRLPVQT